MKVFVIIAVLFTLVTFTDCRHTKGSRHYKRHKKSSIAHVSSPASKRQYYSASQGACCGHYGYPEPYSCCHLSNSPPCCETVHQPQHAVISTNINCCQAPNAPPCCSRVPEQISLQACCTSVHQVSPSQPEHEFVLSVKLVPDGQDQEGGQLCAKPCSSTSAPSIPPTKASPALTTNRPTGGRTTGAPPTGAPTPSLLAICRERALSEHNAKRAIHNAPAMVLDSYLNSVAEVLAKAHLVRLQNPDKRQNKYNGNKQWGINTFDISGLNEDEELDCKTVVEKWYSEVNNYHFNNPGYSSSTRHFTQVVWKVSTKLGIGLAISIDKSRGKKSYVVVATYTKPGNVDGEFSENVEKGQYGGQTASTRCLQEALHYHNSLRRIHNAPPMTLDPQLTEKAYVIAKQLSTTWKRKGHGYSFAGFRGSSNIAAVSTSLLDTVSNVCSLPITLWYHREVHGYDFDNPGYSESTMHFTQLVWKSSTKLGYAMLPMDFHQLLAVAVYSNGNEDGLFDVNVDRGTSVVFSDCEKSVYEFHDAKRPFHGSGLVDIGHDATKAVKELTEEISKNGKGDDASSFEKPGTSVHIDCQDDLDDTTFCTNIMNSWYAEHKNYDFKNPGFNHKARHFTQMVWKGSRILEVGFVKAPSHQHGVIYKYWSGVKDGQLANLKNKPQFPNNPDETRELSEMSSLDRDGDYYGVMLSAYFVPNVTGEYQFYLTCDDQCELKISNDDKPQNAQEVLYLSAYISYTLWSRPTIPIKMEAGKSYYIEATMTQNKGGQHLRVGVKYPNDKVFNRIPIQSDLLLKTPSKQCNALVVKYYPTGNSKGGFQSNVKPSSARPN